MGDYLLAVKKNHKELLKQIEGSFFLNKGEMEDQQWEYSRSKFENRKCQTLSASEMLRLELLKK